LVSPKGQSASCPGAGLSGRVLRKICSPWNQDKKSGFACQGYILALSNQTGNSLFGQ
jgi:hypothetical protein